MGLAGMSATEQFLRLHDWIDKTTDGRIGHKMIGVPTLLLRSEGRRSRRIPTSGHRTVRW
jgi:hypothetical protein